MIRASFEKIKDISLEHVKEYLLLNNWIENKEFNNEKLLVFEKDYDEDCFDIRIPANEEFKDYQPRLLDSLTMISELDDREFNDVLDEIFLLSKDSSILTDSEKDRFSFRIVSDFADNHNLPLDYASEAILGIKNLIVAAISTEREPRKYSPRTNKSALSSLSYFQFAQTNPGSYVFNIEASIPTSQVQVTDESEIDSVPITRKVFSRIQKGIQLLDGGISEENSEKVYEDSYKEGLNANMCEAILKFKDLNCDVKLETSVTWSSKLSCPPDVPKKVTISSNGFNAMKTLAEKYKENSPESVIVAGKITSVDRSDMSITIENNRTRKKIKIVNADFQDFKSACNALKENSNEIIVSGETYNKARVSTLSSYEILSLEF